MKFGVLVFPGSNCDQDCYSALSDVLKQETVYLWHKQSDIEGCDCIVLPGGFSYGDYLRCGAIAKFSPIMKEVVKFANNGGLVIGICNGFQILLESGLLPGAMKRNKNLHFICKYINLKVENTDTPFTNKFKKGDIIRVPIAHGEGNYHSGEKYLKEVEDNNQVIFRYCDENGVINEDTNPNGSLNNIAGICNKKFNVLGMMPHPERCSEKVMLGEDGRKIFESIISAGS
ncbi:phosphoribosylformylglycinamidine synthase subunit PurQ [bacterium]|nr:phosphoribosylformylglycinamidine synthase subunit PurQ [bacterium]